MTPDRGVVLEPDGFAPPPIPPGVRAQLDRVPARNLRWVAWSWARVVARAVSDFPRPPSSIVAVPAFSHDALGRVARAVESSALDPDSLWTDLPAQLDEVQAALDERRVAEARAWVQWLAGRVDACAVALDEEDADALRRAIAGLWCGHKRWFRELGGLPLADAPVWVEDPAADALIAAVREPRDPRPWAERARAWMANPDDEAEGDALIAEAPYRGGVWIQAVQVQIRADARASVPRHTLAPYVDRAVEQLAGGGRFAMGGLLQIQAIPRREGLAFAAMPAVMFRAEVDKGLARWLRGQGERPPGDALVQGLQDRLLAGEELVLPGLATLAPRSGPGGIRVTVRVERDLQDRLRT